MSQKEKITPSLLSYYHTFKFVKKTRMFFFQNSFGIIDTLYGLKLIIGYINKKYTKINIANTLKEKKRIFVLYRWMKAFIPRLQFSVNHFNVLFQYCSAPTSHRPTCIWQVLAKWQTDALKTRLGRPRW